MECQSTHSWTFTELVGAFLDLAIAYFLLCGSTLAYFASKFLGVFGLALPCPCNGLFGIPSSNSYCLRRFLVDCPTEKISNVQLSVKTRFPFDSIWAMDKNCELNTTEFHEKRHVVVEGEASCSSISDARKVEDLIGRESIPKDGFAELGAMNSPPSKEGSKEGRFDLKGKRVANQTPRSGLRRRRKAAFDYGKLSSVGSYDPLRSDVQGVSRCSSSINKEIAEESLVRFSSFGGDGFNVPTDIGLHERVPNALKLDEVAHENNPTNADASLVAEFKGGPGGELGFNHIRFLEQALEEEHAACDALYLELEKERSAAASAADEAMAMILRLQEEKASIEMEARQYQRMIEEKYEYDVEEMNLLKEILLRREREKHFLEKEVEAYRKMIIGNEQLDGDMLDVVDQQGQGASSSSYLSEDPVLMLQQISECIEMKEKVKNDSRSSEYDVRSVESQNCTLALGKELPIFKWDEDIDLSKQGDIQRDPSCDEEFQEKGVVSMEEKPISQKIEVHNLEACSHTNNSSTQAVIGIQKDIISVSKMEQSDKSSLSLGIAQEMTEVHNETEINGIYNGDDIEKRVKDAKRRSGDPCSSMPDNKPHILDVHVIDDESSFANDINENTSKRLSMDATLNRCSKYVRSSEAFGIQKIDVSGDSGTVISLDSDLDIKRKLERSNGLPPMGSSRGKALLSDMRRYSMSAIDYERLKIDTEVEWLRERLRTVQEGREKLNFSVEHTEREKIQLQLLEDIASQLREIRHLTGSGKAVRQASLPLLSSKVTSKKRRYRSVSLGMQRST